MGLLLDTDSESINRNDLLPGNGTQICKYTGKKTLAFAYMKWADEF